MTTYQADIKTMREGQSLAERLLKARQEPTDDEVQQIAAALDATQRVKANRKQADEDFELRRQLADALRPDLPNYRGDSAKTVLFSAKSAASGLADKMSEGGRKALAPSGAEIAPAGLSELRPMELARVATSLLAVVPAQVAQQPPTYSYLKQTTRDNNAAPVATGGVKPTSAYGLTRVEDRLRVIAHLSEPVDKYWLTDNEDLRVFVQDELTYGLDLAVEQQLLTGDGTGENVTGLLNTSGIQTQAWSVDGYETVRRSLTKLQIAGATQYVVAMSPLDFEAMNLVRSTSGEFLATDANYHSESGGATSPPYGPAALRSWGARVVLSNALTPGQALTFDPSAVTLYTDGQVGVEWNSSVRFSTNELIARCEGRFGVAVKRPTMIVSVDMSAA